MLKKLCVLRRAYVVLVVIILSAVNSEASSVIYQFEPISTGPFPDGQTPQIQATFEDENPGTVRLTITPLGLASGEFLSDLYFNFNPADNVKQLHFSSLAGPRGRAFSKVSTGANSFEADGGYYDVHFDLSEAGKRMIFGDDSMTYLIVGPGLDASDFAFLDSTGSGAGTYGAYYALARIQGICGSSEWLGAGTTLQPIPEPASLGLFAFATGLAWCLRSRSNRIKAASDLIKS